MISPKTKIRNVIAPVAIPIPTEPRRFMKNAVAKAAAPMFTRLFPTRIVIISLCGFCLSLYKTSEPFFCCLTRDLTLTEFNDISAVSVPEKNADKKISPIRVII